MTIQKQLINVGVHSDGLAGKMATYMLDSKASATNKKYFEYHKRFKSFYVSKGFPYKPASSLLNAFVGYKSVISRYIRGFYGIKWFLVTP